jgi:cardiolipin synthase
VILIKLLRRAELILGFVSIGLVSSCSSAPPGSGIQIQDSTEPVARASYFGSFGEPDDTDNSTRTTSSLESGTYLVGKSVLLDPLMRPFSTFKALYGLTLKSTSGFIERRLIERVRLPMLEQKPIPELSDAMPMDLAAWELELDRMTGRSASRGSIDLLIDGDAYFSRLEQSINAASQSVDIRTYIYDNDDVALKIANLLRARSDEVDVKILVDGLADMLATRLDSPSMPATSELPPSISEYLTYASKVEFRKQSNPWFTGDHAKITIIDNNLAFLGGMNIGREYRYDWHDIMMEVQGPIVKDLQFKFDQAWSKAGVFGDFAWLMTTLRGYEADLSGEGYPIRILSTSIHNSELYRAQIAAIQRSQNRIYIENTYFSDDRIMFELARARRRGVDVRVILSSKGDSGVLNLSNHKAINVMLRNGIRVYSYPGMTHVKAAVYDGWACLGSANFDKLSLQVNHEINLGTSHPAAVNELVERLFVQDFANSTELYEPMPLRTRHHLAELIADEFF